MQIVDMTKFVIAILFAVIGVGILIFTRTDRGFGQRKQAGALFLVAAAVFGAVGLGYLEL